MSKYKKHRPMCHMILLILIINALFSIVLGLDTTNSQERVKVKYRHRRENDEDENFIALAPADGDEFNLESVLNKDKQMPSIVRLDPVSDQEDDDENDDFNEFNSETEDTTTANLKNENNKNYDEEKFNRFFDSVDINEEQKRIFNESLNNDSSLAQIFDKVDEESEDYFDSTTVLTTSTTSTISPYVREIYKTSSEEENDEDEELQQQHNRNHHSKFKKKHTRKHHKKHHAQPSSYHLPGVNEYYSHSFSPAYHHFSSRLGINNGGSRGSHHHHHHNKYHNNNNNKHKISQTYGTEQRQVKDDGQYQYRSGYRANYGSDQYRGRISFFDNSNKLETSQDIDRKLNGRTKEKYPYFNKVKTHLEEEDEDLPPYIKKYNRRNKQLIDLLEGTLPPQSDNLRRFHSHTKKNPHWLEDDLFEEQRPSKNKWSTEIEATQHPNALPDESVHVVYDDDQHKSTLTNISKNKSSLTNNKTATFNLTASSIASNNHSPPFKLSSRAGQFVYHTVTQSPSIGASGGSGGGGNGYGGVKKKRLPFVAITDRKVGGPPRMRRTSMNSINSEQQQNRLPMP